MMAEELLRTTSVHQANPAAVPYAFEPVGEGLYTLFPRAR